MNSASGARLDGIVDSLYQMVGDVKTEQCYWLVTDKDVVLMLSEDAAVDGALEYPEWRGGLPEDVSYHALGLEISVSNGHRTNPEMMANRYVRGLDIAMMAAKLKQMYPDTNIEGLLRRIYDTMDISELRKLVLGEPAPEQSPGQGPAPGNGAAADPRQIPAAGGAGA
ncbi:MAG: hypothetical protein GY926_02775, partial [bacterium]|nr:hypothetical protein [bacterium]